MINFKRVRWSHNDKYFGPFTYCNSDYNRIGLILGSGGEYGEQSSLRMHFGTLTLIAALPQWVLRPYRERVIANSWDADTIARLGRNWYEEIYEREYGFSYSEKSLHVYYGAQTHCWPGSKSKVYFIPWLSWRHIRTSYYGLQGEHYHTEPKNVRWDSPEYEASRALVDACPSASFVIKDYDGEEIIATTKINEIEWRLGEGYFKWLSVFKKPKIRRSLDISFSAEVGPEKGSWKGGTTGHSIDMKEGEMHEQAFKRYCEQEHRSKYRNFNINYIGATK